LTSKFFSTSGGWTWVLGLAVEKLVPGNMLGMAGFSWGLMWKVTQKS